MDFVITKQLAEEVKAAREKAKTPNATPKSKIEDSRVMMGLMRDMSFVSSNGSNDFESFGVNGAEFSKLADKLQSVYSCKGGETLTWRAVNELEVPVKELARTMFKNKMALGFDSTGATSEQATRYQAAMALEGYIKGNFLLPEIARA